MKKVKRYEVKLFDTGSVKQDISRKTYDRYNRRTNLLNTKENIYNIKQVEDSDFFTSDTNIYIEAVLADDGNFVDGTLLLYNTLDDTKAQEKLTLLPDNKTFQARLSHYNIVHSGNWLGQFIFLGDDNEIYSSEYFEFTIFKSLMTND